MISDLVGKLVRRWPLLRVLAPSKTDKKNELGMIISQSYVIGYGIKVRVLWFSEREHDIVHGFYVDPRLLNDGASILNEMLDLSKKGT